MTEIKSGAAKALANLAEGEILATVEIAAPPERVFRALASKEIIDWWVRSGVFDTREWTGDVRKGGRWRASGVARGQPYVLEGEFLEVQPPTKLVHTWQRVGMPSAPTTVTYLHIFSNNPPLLPPIPELPVEGSLKHDAKKNKYFPLHSHPPASVAEKEREEVAKALSNKNHK